MGQWDQDLRKGMVWDVMEKGGVKEHGTGRKSSRPSGQSMAMLDMCVIHMLSPCKQ